MQIALLGAGHIGQSIARWLTQSGDYQITVADHDIESLKRLDAAGIPTRHLSIEDPVALQDFLRNHDAVINALPFFAAITVARAAHAVGMHYFDMTEDVKATQTIAALAKTSKSAFMPQCGLAPGFVGIATHALTQGFDTIDTVKMRVGALPQHPNNSLKYNLTWSVDGLINEYCQPCEAIRDHQPATVMALEGLEHLTVDGVDYEAFNTSGGLGTLCQTLQGKVRTLDYKSMRYPGHHYLARFLIHDLKLGDKPEMLKQCLQDAIPTTTQDMVIVFIAVSGWRNGQYVQDVFTRRIVADTTSALPASAIQIATTAGICAAVDLFRAGKLPQCGFIGQEDVALEDVLKNRFGRAYNATPQ